LSFHSIPDIPVSINRCEAVFPKNVRQRRVSSVVLDVGFNGNRADFTLREEVAPIAIAMPIARPLESGYREATGFPSGIDHLCAKTADFRPKLIPAELR
jgi:hypothetical protein